MPEIETFQTQPPVEIDDILQEFDKRILAGKEILGYVMVGGGSLGRYQRGVNRRLRELQILQRVQSFYGASVGTLNSAIESLFINNDNGPAELWDAILKNSDVYLGQVPSSKWDIVKLIATMTPWRKNKLLDESPLIKIFEKYFPNPNMLIKELPIPVYGVSTDMIAGKRVTFGPNDKVTDMLRATCALPDLFDLYMGRYADGGIMDNEPFDIAVENKCTKVLGTFCHADQAPTEIPLKNMFDIGYRTLQIMIAANELKIWKTVDMMQQLRKALKQDPIEIWMIWPSKDTGDFLNFNNPWIEQLGYNDACQFFTREKIANFLLS